MKTKEIILEIDKLPASRKLLIAEHILKSIRESDEEMKEAADILSDDYENDKDMSAFTVLDFEEFYEAG